LALVALLAACNPEPADPEIVTVTETVTNTVTNTVTHTVEVPVVETIVVTEPNTIIETVVDDDLDGGRFSQPIVWLQDVIDNGGAIGSGGGGENHMHLSEMVYREQIPDTDGVDATSNGAPPMLIQCSYYFGWYNATNPASMSIAAQGWRHAKTTGTKEPGCIHLALDDDDREIVFTTHHGGITDGLAFLSGWDLNLVNSTSDSNLDGIVDNAYSVTTAPVEIPKLTEADVSYEGLDVEDGIIWVTLHKDGLGMYTFDYATSVFTRVGSYDVGLENSWDVLVLGDRDLAYVADGIGGLVSLDITDPMNPVELDRVLMGGQARDIMVNGDTVYVAAESGGVAVIDAADPSNMQLVNTMDVGNGGAIAIDYDNGYLYVAAWNDARVYDTTLDPQFPVYIGAVRHTVSKEYNVEGDEERPDITDRVLAVAGKDDFLFNGTWWVPTNYAINKGTLAPYIDLPQTYAQMTFPGDLNAGETTTYDILIENDGNADLTVTDIWSTNAAFEPNITQVVVPPGGETTVTVTFTATIGLDGVDTADTAAPQSAEETGILNIVSDDPSQPIRQGYMEANIDSLGVGDPMPDANVLLTDGSDWLFSRDALGSVTVIAYFATF